MGCDRNFFWPLLCAMALIGLGGCDSSSSEKAPITATQLHANFTKALSDGNDSAALVIAGTLEKRYPDSAELAQVRVQLPAIRARVQALRAEQEARAKAKRAEEAAAAERLARETRAKDEEQFRKVLAKMTRKYDAVEHTTFFQPKANPARAGADTYVTLYVGRDDAGSAWLRTRLQYGGDDWIFFDTIKFSIDGTTLPAQNLGHFSVQRDNSGGDVWEWIDLSVPDEARQVFDQMASGKVVVVRFEGKYRHDLTLSAKAKESLRDSLELYRLLKAGMKP